MPQGPPVWICGDCHSGNLGPIADEKGRVEIEIRDMDQSVIGNPAHDLVRLALSLAMSARGSDLPGVTTARLMEQIMAGYQEGLPGNLKKVREDPPKAISHALKRALRRKWRHLAEERIEDVRPTIPLGKCFWPLTGQEKHDIQRLFATDDARKLVTALHNRDAKDAVELVDAAYWVKGCSSLGAVRYAALLRVGKGDPAESGLCLMDIKEAVKAAAPRARNVRMPRNNGERVVTGAKHLSPYLGDRMLSAAVCNRSVFIRELMPQDLKLELDQVTCEEAVAIARFLATVVGRAHGRQMDADTQKQWCSALNSRTSKMMDAPTWLWACVMELIASHEVGYLEHCRKYAMGML